MWRGISLANKCLLLFGAAVVLIIIAALSVPWLRLGAVVDEGQHETSRQIEAVWNAARRPPSSAAVPPPATPDAVATPESLGLGPVPGKPETIGGPSSGLGGGGSGTIVYLTAELVEPRAEAEPFIRAAWRRFNDDPDVSEYHDAEWQRAGRAYYYARAVRDAEGSLEGMVYLQRLSPNAAGELLINTAYLLSAGLIALGLAVLVFYLITSRLILSPVRSLKATAEVIREGDFKVRSDITTGDEFEELSDAFNQMLEALTASQQKLRAINESLDLKVNELAERNIALFEANRIKGEFLANVSHELRTPLNSIIGFAELLLEIAIKEEAAGDDSSRLAKRKRYLENITGSGKSLLDLIDGLLEMAKVEAGKMDLRVQPVNVADLCEGLAALIRPLADKAGVEVVVDLGEELGTIETDGKKLQQILFNLLSNAVKFTGEYVSEGAAGEGKPARVTLRAERLAARSAEGPGAGDRVRLCVLDTGPGIAEADKARIFEKFEQLDGSHTRKHAGTGLGLAIAKELTAMLQGEIGVESEPGRGSMFSVILPTHLDPQRSAEVRAEMAFRGKMAGQLRGT